MAGTDNSTAQMKASRKLARACGFAVLVIVLIAFLSALFTPSFVEKREDRVHKIYDQQRNSVQVLCLGASTMLVGCSPAYLYENFGIATFNGCTSDQPTVTSLYVLKDVLRRQGDSLTTVIVDASPLLSDESEGYVSKRATAAFADMRPSLVKTEYLFELNRAFKSVAFVEEAFPLLKYHGRWAELASGDFGVASYEGGASYTHGQLIDKRLYRSNVSQKRAGKFTTRKNEAITAERSFADDELQALWNGKNVKYFRMLVEFCEERDLDVLLVRMPTCDWGDEQHDAVSMLADECGVPFLDMAMPDALESCGVDYDTDYYDNKHPNLAGSAKLTDYLGRYLAANYDFADARDGSVGTGQAISPDDLARYHRAVDDARLLQCMRFDEYLQLLDDPRYTVLVAAKGEAAEGLDGATRGALSALGLQKLSALQPNESYVGVLGGGECLAEEVSNEGTVSLSGALRSGSALVEPLRPQAGASVADALQLKSDGRDKSATCAIKVSGEDVSEGNRGINIAVYSAESGLLLDTASFDTHEGLARTSDVLPEQAEGGES